MQSKITIGYNAPNYTPGSQINGIIYLQTYADIKKPSFLTLYLIGEERSKATHRYTQTRGNIKFKYHTDVFEVLTDYTKFLVYKHPIYNLSRIATGTMNQGQFEFPFSFVCPDNCPSSLNTNFIDQFAKEATGSIEYKLEAILHCQPNNVKHSVDILIYANSIPNNIPKELSTNYLMEYFGCCSKGDISMKARIDKSQYRVGEVANLQLSFEKANVKIQIHKIEILLEYFIEIKAKGKALSKSKSVINKIVQPGFDLTQNKKDYSIKLNIQKNLPHNSDGKMIKSRYSVKVIARTQYFCRCGSENPNVKIGIQIQGAKDFKFIKFSENNWNPMVFPVSQNSCHQIENFNFSDFNNSQKDKYYAALKSEKIIGTPKNFNPDQLINSTIGVITPNKPSGFSNMHNNNELDKGNGQGNMNLNLNIKNFNIVNNSNCEFNKVRKVHEKSGQYGADVGEDSNTDQNLDKYVALDRIKEEYSWDQDSAIDLENPGKKHRARNSEPQIFIDDINQNSTPKSIVTNGTPRLNAIRNRIIRHQELSPKCDRLDNNQEFNLENGNLGIKDELIFRTANELGTGETGETGETVEVKKHKCVTSSIVIEDIDLNKISSLTKPPDRHKKKPGIRFIANKEIKDAQKKSVEKIKASGTIFNGQPSITKTIVLNDGNKNINSGVNALDSSFNIVDNSNPSGIANKVLASSPQPFVTFLLDNFLKGTGFIQKIDKIPAACWRL